MRVEQIGDATLYLGDCMDILPTLGKVDTVVTDPPYGMSFKSNYRKEKHRAIENDETEDLLVWACGLEAAHSKYIFCRWDNIYSCPKPKSLITWVKNNWSMGDLDHEHGRQTEVCLFYPGKDHQWGSGRPSDVVFDERTGNDLHPTQKPITLMKKIIQWTAGVVFDPFMGSGTTGVAALDLGRKFIGVEKDEKYFDIACKRIDDSLRQGKLF